MKKILALFLLTPSLAFAQPVQQLMQDRQPTREKAPPPSAQQQLDQTDTLVLFYNAEMMVRDKTAESVARLGLVIQFRDELRAAEAKIRSLEQQIAAPAHQPASITPQAHQPAPLPPQTSPGASGL